MGGTYRDGTSFGFLDATMSGEENMVEGTGSTWVAKVSFHVPTFGASLLIPEPFYKSHSFTLSRVRALPCDVQIARGTHSDQLTLMRKDHAVQPQA
jgi:hypothetical protein